MQLLKNALSLLLLTLFLGSCASYKSKQQIAALTFPQLGGIIETKGELWFGTAEQIGALQWENPAQIMVQELPFNKASYANYANYMQTAGKINSIPYVDSLPYKPKYLRLQLVDKISLVQVLNAGENKNVRSYLENDDAFKIVTRWDITATDALMVQLLEADAVLMEENPQNKMQLVLIKDKKKQLVSQSELQVFDYDFSTFCWGEDRYHNKRIETLLTGNARCPKGTYKKAVKVTSDKSYLKF